MMRALGAEVVLVEQASGGVPGRVTGHDMRLVRQRAAELVKELRAFFVDQFENPANALAHERVTADELWQQCDGKIDAIVAFAGSGGAMSGLVRGSATQTGSPRVYR